MKLKFTAVLFLIFALGCQTQQKQSVGGNKNIDKVRDLYTRAEKIKLPLVWENTSNEYPVAKDKLIPPDKYDIDLFEGGANYSMLMGYSILLGVLEDTSKFYTFLFSYPADDTRPLIITLDKEGKLISKLLSSYSCGADCGYYCIGATFNLNKDFSFKSRHMSYSADCIENDSKLDTSKVTYTVLEKVGFISKKGKIKEKEQRIAEERNIPFSSKENPIKYTK